MTVVLVIAVWVSCAASLIASWNLVRAARRYRMLGGEVAELQAIVDGLLMEHGRPPVYATRYGLTIATDPTKMPPPVGQ